MRITRTLHGRRRALRVVFAAGLLGVWPSLAASARAEGRVLKVFILAGQSNAAGAGNADELPAELHKLPEHTFLFERRKARAPGWQPIMPYPRVDEAKRITRAAFGIEIPFADALVKAQPDIAIGIVKQTRGGTSVVAWDKGHERPDFAADLKMVQNQDADPQYPLLVRDVREALAAAAQLPGVSRVELAAFLWVQVERDSTKGKAVARLFPKRLGALIDNLRQEFQVPKLPVICLGPHNGADQRLVQAGLDGMVKRDPHMRVVTSRDLPTYEGIHFDTKGQLELGRRFARAYLTLATAANPAKKSGRR